MRRQSTDNNCGTILISKDEVMNIVTDRSITWSQTIEKIAHLHGMWMVYEDVLSMIPEEYKKSTDE